MILRNRFNNLIYELIRKKNDYLSKKPQISSQYDLQPNQIYPFGSNQIENNINEIGLIKKNRLLSNTKVISIGTCFAEEIAGYFSRNIGIVNYLKLEKSIYNASANWGRVYTVRNLYQILEYSYKAEFPVEIEIVENRYFDLLRDKSVGYYSTYEEAVSKILEHRKISAAALVEADIIIITLGQNEGWINRKSNLMLGSLYGENWFRENKSELKLVELSFNDNLNLLKKCIDILKENNTDVIILLTVSPVPAFATFFNENVVVQSMGYKSTLRAMIHELLRNHFYENVYYYPSFELVICNNSASYTDDNRHVKFQRVQKVMKHFRRILSNGHN